MKECLKDLMNKELQKITNNKEYLQLENFITHDDLSATFIRSILNDPDFIMPDVTSDIFSVAQSRARHSTVTFLIGLVFKNFSSLYSSFSNILGNNDVISNYSIWLILSLYHDIGYFSEYINKDELNYIEKFEYYLLQDCYKKNELNNLNNFSINYPKAFAYTYDEIVAYDRYARDFHKNRDDKEKIDHGILGGILTFNKFVNKYLRNKTDINLLMIKLCCITIAQHNFYKSSSVDYDPQYPIELEKLKSTSTFKIGKNTPLLLFLCLIDTIECVKKFSKSENSDRSLQTLTVLSAIKVSVDETSVEIDYSDLHKSVLSKNDSELIEKYDEYLDSVKNLNTWTHFYITTNDKIKDVVTITLN